MSGFINPDKPASNNKDTSTEAPKQTSKDTADEKSSNENANASINVSEVDKLTKRLTDLQSFSQKRVNEKDAEIERLQKALEDKSIASLPSSKEELEEFAKSQPALHGLMVRMVKEEAMQTEGALGKQLKHIEEKTQEVSYRQFNKDLLEKQPDANTIKESQEFKDWWPNQSQYTIDILTRQDSSIDDISFVLDRYKQEKGLVETKETKKKQQQKEGAEAVINSEKGAPSESGTTEITESWVAGLSEDEFDQHRDIILKAHEDKTIVNDLTG